MVICGDMMPRVVVQDVSLARRLLIEPLLEQLFARCDVPEITLSRQCARLLIDATRACGVKKHEDNILSSSTFFFVVCLYARRLANEGEPQRDADIEHELTRLREVGSALNGNNGGRLDALIDDFFYKIPSLDFADFDRTPLASSGVPELGPGMMRTITTAATKGPLSAPGLMLLLAENTETGIAGRLRMANLLELAGAIRTSAGPRGGRHSRMKREADPDELALSVDDYANALAAVLRAAQGEFTFALFGHWGSGKTTLVKRLTPVLEALQVAAPKTGGGSFPSAQPRYHVAIHNAWKYRTPPEAWIFAFKTLAERAACSVGPVGRTMLALRSSMHRRGRLPLYTFLTASAFALISLGSKIELILMAISLVGLSTLLYFVPVAIGLSRRTRALFAEHVKLTSANEKLGMLALVGDDIRALLRAWVSEDVSFSAFRRPFWDCVGLPLLFTVCITTVWLAGMFGFGTDLSLADLASQFTKLFDPSNELAGTVQSVSHLSEPKTREWFGVAFWCALALGMLVLPWFWRGGRPDRVLLVVDDLDRCSPPEMLNVIESFRLLLDEQAVQDRLQVLMLLDEHVLEHAIATRYSSMIKERASEAGDGDESSETAARREIVTEQNEKLFACHLRIAGLRDEDVKAVVAALASQELNNRRRERYKAEEAQLADERRSAIADVENARRRREDAQRDYIAVHDGHPTPLKDPEAPRRASFWMGDNIRTGDRPVASSADQAITEVENGKTSRENERVKKLAPNERLEERPWVVQLLEKANAELIVAEEREHTLGTAEPILSSDDVNLVAPFDESDVRFTASEIDELRVFVPAYFHKIGRRPSPRAIRILLFRIQLCRLLLDVRHPGRLPSARSIRTILQAFEQAATTNLPSQGEDEAIAIARQVI